MKRILLLVTLALMLATAMALSGVAMAADINKTVSVLAKTDDPDPDWQDTGILLRAGDHVVIDGSGTVDLDCNSTNFDNTPPDGVSPPNITNDPSFLAPNLNVGALIGKIDNGDPFVVGELKTINSVASSGELFLAVNDSGDADNCGNFTADIAVDLAPTVQGTNPADGATNVPVDAKIRVKFSEPMKDRSINTANIYLTKAEDPTTIIPAKVDYVDEITPVRAVLKPLAPLEPNTEYTVTVEGKGDGDKKAVKDASGTRLATDYTFSFTTAP
jgi:hypothetical protein